MSITYNHIPDTIYFPGDVCRHELAEQSLKATGCPCCGASDISEPYYFVTVFKNHNTGEWIEKWIPESEYDELMNAQYMEVSGK